ncbi:MAG: hypothetical protein ACRECJ_11220 [Limisphaerales bacterium]
MKRFPVSLMLGLGFCLFWAVLAFAQTPDPRDSVIIESKTVNPGAGAPAVRVKVFISNKDTLSAVSVGLVEKSLTGGAYMTLARPRTFDGVVTRLTTTLGSWKTLSVSRYNSVSPDTFIMASFFDPETQSGFEPPNLVRKAFWEIKFDSIWSATGTIALDSVKGFGGLNVMLVSAAGKTVWVNFVKGTITVEAPPPPCNDMNGDGGFTTADIVETLNCVFLGVGDCGPISTPADVVKLLMSLFSSPMPLIPPTPCN